MATTTSQLLLVLSLLLAAAASAAALVPPSNARPPRPSSPAPSLPAAKAREGGGVSAGLVSTLRETLDAIRGVASVISSFPIGGILGGGDLRLSSAVADCLDLLVLSADELSWSMSTTSSASSDDDGYSPASAGGRLGTGDARSDLRSWLSGALGNQDTCREGLDETGSPLASLVAAGLDAVTSLLAAGLGRRRSSRRERKRCPARVDIVLVLLLPPRRPRRRPAVGAREGAAAAADAGGARGPVHAMRFIAKNI